MTTQLRPFRIELATEFWYEALQEEIGITFETEDMSVAKYIESRLYDARKGLGDPRLDDLVVHTNKDGKRVMIYRKNNEALP